MQNIDLTVSEDGEPRTVISIRAMVTITDKSRDLIQDDLVPPVGNEIKAWRNCEEVAARLSRDGGYLRSGSLQVKQKFTIDLKRPRRLFGPRSVLQAPDHSILT